ncbi:MAG: hypothetical protein OEU54_13575 [Gemmatimonadota bacterium]|nr:hypothetical protein [Gemmatimonadota bacterium]
MNPLFLQIAIGAGALLVGFLIGTLMAGKRLRKTRKAAQQQADDFESQLAIKRLRIHELKARLESDVPDEPLEPLPPSLTKMSSATPTRPRWLATPAERTPDSAPPRA